MSPLENLVFPEQIQQSTFQEILASLDHVSAEFVSREEFEGKWWEFLEASGESDEFWQFYTLFLPHDLTILELPAIIKHLNRHTFWEELPLFASTKELQIKLCILYGEVIQKEESSQRNTAIKNIYTIYEEMFWEDEVRKIGSEEYREGIINQWERERFTRFIQNITANNLNELREELADEVENHFYESFFENGINTLRLWMMTITQAEQEALKEKSKSLKNEEEIAIHKSTETLDEQERLLRDKIGIEELKADLDAARESGHQREVARLEKHATKKILQTLYEYPWQVTSNHYGYEPAEILRHKEIYCVGFALLWNSFLSELWIKHRWLDIPRHSALEVTLWWELYYFDPTASTRIHRIYYGKQIGEYRETTLDTYWHIIDFGLIQAGDPEKILFSHILNNKWSALHKLWKYEEAIEAYDMALDFNPQFASAYNNKWASLYKLWRYEEAIEEYDMALKLNPQDASAYYNKWNTLGELWRYEEAIQTYDTALKHNPQKASAYNNKWNVLNKLWRYKEAIEAYDMVLKLNPQDADVYNNKWIALRRIWEHEIARLYFFVSKKLKWENPWYWFRQRTEKRDLETLIQEWDFEGVRQYLQKFTSTHR